MLYYLAEEFAGVIKLIDPKVESILDYPGGANVIT